MFRRFIAWLGSRRAWGLFLLLAITGTLSLMLQAVGTDVPWVIPVQNGLFLVALVGAVGVLLSRLDPIDRRPLIVSIGPLVLGFGLGILLPDFLVWFVGAGVGWLILAQIVLRRNVRREYQQAIRHLRRNEYDEAIRIMGDLIRAEPAESSHYRFRADLYRLQGKPIKALQDYRRIVELEPQSGVGYNGLAEVYLQEGDLPQALIHARQANEVEPDQWVMPYNLGMIEDRLGMSDQVVAHLRRALEEGRPDARHRVLIHLWLARAHARLGQTAEAEAELGSLRRLKRGIQEWQTIIASEQAAALRQVLAEDIALVQRLADGAGVQALDAMRSADEAGV